MSDPIADFLDLVPEIWEFAKQQTITFSQGNQSALDFSNVYVALRGRLEKAHAAAVRGHGGEVRESRCDALKAVCLKLLSWKRTWGYEESRRLENFQTAAWVCNGPFDAASIPEGAEFERLAAESKRNRVE